MRALQKARCCQHLGNAAMTEQHDLVELVARAICVSTGVGPDLKYEDGQPAWTGYVKHARAAIAAMEPELAALRDRS